MFPQSWQQSTRAQVSPSSCHCFQLKNLRNLFLHPLAHHLESKNALCTFRSSKNNGSISWSVSQTENNKKQLPHYESSTHVPGGRECQNCKMPVSKQKKNSTCSSTQFLIHLPHLCSATRLLVKKTDQEKLQRRLKRGRCLWVILNGH